MAKNNDRKKTTRKKFFDLEDKILGETGLGGTYKREPRPHYNKCEDQMYYNHKNSYIIFGRDRNASRFSGLGGLGGTKCDSIDIVTGLSSAHTKDGPPDKDITVNPNFYSDAARIYITQKGNIDKYFGIAKGGEIFSSKNQSAIAIKADHSRIIGRNSVKIVAGKGRMEKTKRFGEKNSQGADEEHTGFTIDLIAGNNTDPSVVEFLPKFDFFGKRLQNKLQPLVKGENLTECLEEVYSFIRDCLHLIGENNKDIVKLYSIMGSHYHEIVAPTPTGTFIALPSATLGNICFPKVSSSGKRLIENKIYVKNTNFSTIHFLDPLGNGYINSKSVRTT